MDTKQFKEIIQETICDDGGLSPADYICKTSNIESFLHINRNGLQNGKLEKRLLMYKSLAEEAIFIEYPGKESTSIYAESEEKNILNPNDFRPELITKEGEVLAKLSLADIVEAVVEYGWKHDEETMKILAALLIRLAYMKGYKCKELVHPSHLIVVHSKKHREIMPEKQEDIIKRYFLPINSETKEYLSNWDKINLPSRDYLKKIPISIEGFLYYLDILAQQEDCKYYYTRKFKGEKTLKVEVGRINNLLTVVNVISRILNNRPYGDIVASLGKYVRPIKVKEIVAVTNGVIKTVSGTESITEMEIK